MQSPAHNRIFVPSNQVGTPIHVVVTQAPLTLSPVATPASLSPSPVVSLGSHSYSTLLEDDYFTNKFNFKVKSQSLDNGVFNFKQTIDLAKPYPVYEAKIQWPHNRYFFWLGFKPNDHKFHVDLGECTFVKRLRYYANLRSNEKGHIVKVGTVHEGEHCNAHTRFEYANEELSLTSRARFQQKGWVGVFAGTFNLSTLAPSRYDFLVGHVEKDRDFFLRHYSTSKDSFNLGRVIANAVYRVTDQNTFGIEAEYPHLKDADGVKITVGTSKKMGSSLCKLKANLNDRSVFFSSRGKFLDSCQLPVGPNFKSSHKFLPVPLGFTLETTI